MTGKIAKRNPGRPPATDARAGELLRDVRRMIEEGRRQVAATVNVALTVLYWRIGKRIGVEVLGGERAAYGDEIVVTLSRQLEAEYGRGFADKNLRRMVQFAEVFPDEQIVVTLMRQLSWSHFVALVPLKDPQQRDFYAEMCRVQHWSVRQLRQQIDSMLYERTALSRRPESVIEAQLEALREQDALSTDLVLKDPYLLDFLGLRDRYLEKDLEDAILRELEAFVLELGTGFCFIARQMRLQIDGDDFYIDLVFYNRKLRRLVAVELKVGAFKAAYKGQMELYLRWLDRHAREPGEESPLGIILCTGKKREQIELLELGDAGIHVAEYLTVLPPREELGRKLRAAIDRSRERLAVKEGEA